MNLLKRCTLEKNIHKFVQFFFFCFCVTIGVQFLSFALWAMGRSSTFVPRPPSVEAFLPVSALLAAKRFLITYAWDPVHPAGLVLFFYAIFVSFMIRKAFCGYICPIGAVSHALFRLGNRLGVCIPLPRWASYLLSAPKYFLLAFFLKTTIFGMGKADIEAFLFSHYNMVCDTKMLLFFMQPSSTLTAVLLLLLLASLLFPSFWCRAFCPYGALLGLFSLFSFCTIYRDVSKCNVCGMCEKNCPTAIPIMRKESIRNPECVGCMECVAACPNKSLSMRFGTKKGRRIHASTLVIILILSLLIFFSAAYYTDHWNTCVPLEMVRPLHSNIATITH